jgi:hypothetical protein
MQTHLDTYLSWCNMIVSMSVRHMITGGAGVRTGSICTSILVIDTLLVG